jgi:hypothetical protein
LSISTIIEVVGEDCGKTAFSCDHRFGKLTEHRFGKLTDRQCLMGLNSEEKGDMYRILNTTEEDSLDASGRFLMAAEEIQ